MLKPFDAILSIAQLVHIQNYSKGQTYVRKYNFTNLPHLYFGGVN